MLGLFKVFLLLTIGYATVTDSLHMQSCVVCVRDAVSAGHTVIDRLTHQAGGKVETVILYLLRACYYSMSRTGGEYSVEKLYTLAKNPFQVSPNMNSKCLKNSLGWRRLLEATTN